MMQSDYYWLIMDYQHDSGLKLFLDIEISWSINFLTLKFSTLNFCWVVQPSLVICDLQWSMIHDLSEPYLALRTCFRKERLISKGLFGMSAYRFLLPWVDKFDETFSGYKIFLALIRQPLLFYLQSERYKQLVTQHQQMEWNRIIG